MVNQAQYTNQECSLMAINGALYTETTFKMVYAVSVIRQLQPLLILITVGMGLEGMQRKVTPNLAG